jgi:hypothetical protein
VDAQAGGARDLRAAQLARPGAPRGAVQPVAVDIPVAPEFAVDRGSMPPQPAGDLALAHAHLHQTAQAASLFKCEVAVSLSHGDPGHSRCRTWFVRLRPTSQTQATSKIDPKML